MPCASRVGRARRDGAREGRRGCSGRRRSYRLPASAARAANAAAAGAAARAAGARIARRVLPPGRLKAAGRQYSLDRAREGRRGCSGRRRSYRSPASAAAANAAAAGAAARAAGARIARRVLPSGSLEAAGRQYSLDLTSRARAEARTARARPAASRRRRNMATVQPLRRRKRLAGSAVCRRGAVLGC